MNEADNGVQTILFEVHGFVQGVGYRAYVSSIANKYGIKGYVKNMPDGSVEILASGNKAALSAFRQAIKIDQENGPQVKQMQEKALEGRQLLSSFKIL